MSRVPATSDLFTAIADPTRRQMLSLLVGRDLTVNELMKPFAMSQPAVSQHLRILRDVGLVKSEPWGRERVYSLDPEPLREVYDWVEHFSKFWDDRLSALGQYLDKSAAPRRAKRRKTK